MNGDAGKGSKWRKEVDFKKYWTNYPTLTGNTISTVKKIEKKKGKIKYVY